MQSILAQATHVPPFCLLELICCCHNSTAGITDYFVTQAHAGGDIGGIHGNSFLTPLILTAMYFYILDTVFNFDSVRKKTPGFVCVFNEVGTYQVSVAF